MIDFRYHIVSIVSIFLALAVGIVLGAGPLQGQIGDTLTQEVTALRKDKSDLRAQTDAAEKGAAARDAFDAEIAPDVVADVLPRTRVAVLTLPAADPDVVKGVIALTRDAGAEITSTTSVQDAWTDPDAAAVAQRADLARSLLAEAGLATEDTAGTGPFDLLLASALTEKARTSIGEQAARTVLDALAEAGYVDVDAATAVPADLAIVVSGPVTDGDEAERTRVATRYADLSVALAAASKGAVLVSDVGVSGASAGTSVVRVVRADDDMAKVLSTVDTGSIPMGQVSTVWALAQQQAGGVGQYGLDAGASAPFPPAPSP